MTLDASRVKETAENGPNIRQNPLPGDLSDSGAIEFSLPAEVDVINMVEITCFPVEIKRDNGLLSEKIAFPPAAEEIRPPIRRCSYDEFHEIR